MDIKKEIKGHSSLSPAVSDNMQSFSVSVSKKCERLSTALYLVTNFLSDTEPLKSRLRTLSIELVRDSAAVRYGSTTNETNVLESLRANISETLSLLELSFIAGLVSEMNFSILKREYGTLRDGIEIKKASRESRSDNVLGETFFGSSFQNNQIVPPSQKHRIENSFERTTRQPNRSEEIENPYTDIFKGQISRQVSDNNGHKVAAAHPTVLETSSAKETQKGQRGNHNQQQKFSTPNVSKDARQARILKLIRDNKEVTIKDISNHFSELSEKTIQRELATLVASGVLKKEGDRRWSRYALI